MICVVGGCCVCLVNCMSVGPVGRLLYCLCDGVPGCVLVCMIGWWMNWLLVL